MGKENLDMGWIKDSWSGELVCLHLNALEGKESARNANFPQLCCCRAGTVHARLASSSSLCLWAGFVSRVAAGKLIAYWNSVLWKGIPFSFCFPFLCQIPDWNCKVSLSCLVGTWAFVARIHLSHSASPGTWLKWRSTLCSSTALCEGYWLCLLCSCNVTRVKRQVLRSVCWN